MLIADNKALLILFASPVPTSSNNYVYGRSQVEDNALFLVRCRSISKEIVKNAIKVYSNVKSAYIWLPRTHESLE